MIPSSYSSRPRLSTIPKPASGGFTIIELVVTLGIVVLATGLVMIRYASFNSSVLLTSQAYEIAFDLRETQSLAISVRGNADEFRQEYGMHFDINSPNQYLLMQDGIVDQDLKTTDTYIRYDEGEEIGGPILIDPRFTIVELCAVRASGGPKVCRSASSGTGLNFITIAFARPDFDAVMEGDGIGKLREAEIVLGTDQADGLTRSIIIKDNGMISVENAE